MAMLGRIQHGGVGITYIHYWKKEIDRNSDEGSPPPTPIRGKDDLREDLYKCFVKADELIEKVGKVNLDVLLQWLFSDGKVIMKNQYRTPRAKMVVNLISSNQEQAIVIYF